MSAEVLQMISIIAYVLAGILGITAVILFFKLNVRAIIDDLSGKTAERQIRELRETNHRSEISRNGRKHYEPSTENVTAKIVFAEPDKAIYKETTSLDGEETELLEDGRTLLAEDCIKSINGYKLLLNEIVVHTEERI